jgi:hypothetical protein
MGVVNRHHDATHPRSIQQRPGQKLGLPSGIRRACADWSRDADERTQRGGGGSLSGGHQYNVQLLLVGRPCKLIQQPRPARSAATGHDHNAPTVPAAQQPIQTTEVATASN